MTADFLFREVFIPAIVLLPWVIPLGVVLTAVALLVAFVIEGFSTLFGGSGRNLPAFREDADLQWKKLDRYIDESLADTEHEGGRCYEPIGHFSDD